MHFIIRLILGTGKLALFYQCVAKYYFAVQTINPSTIAISVVPIRSVRRLKRPNHRMVANTKLSTNRNKCGKAMVLLPEFALKVYADPTSHFSAGTLNDSHGWC